MNPQLVYLTHTGEVNELRIVYVDLLFLSNLAVNYLLLVLTARLSGVYASRVRLALAAAFGAVFAVLLFFPSLPTGISAMSKVLLCAAITAIAFGGQPVGEWPRIGLIFLAITFAFAGGVLALQYITGGAGASLSNGVPYFNISLKILLCSTLAAYALLRLVFSGGAMELHKKTAQIQLQNSQKSVKLQAFTDTGNMLRDPLTGKHIIVISFQIAQSLFSGEALEQIRALNAENTLEIFTNLTKLHPGRFSLVPCKTAVAGGMMLCAKLDAVLVNGKKQSKYLIGFSTGEVETSNGCRAIIGV